jgi:hypothetical protein
MEEMRNAQRTLIEKFTGARTLWRRRRGDNTEVYFEEILCKSIYFFMISFFFAMRDSDLSLSNMVANILTKKKTNFY